jgi:excisionase family DNA binding protein
MEKLGYSVEDAAPILGVGRTTIFELIATGQLESVKIGRRRMTKRESRPRGAAPEQSAQTATAIIPHSIVTIDRPRCTVVGAYCEALHWLWREPASRATWCCRSYWADVEARWSA